MADKPSFEVREAGYPIPSQLKRDEISAELRALIWNSIYTNIIHKGGSGNEYVTDSAISVLKIKHVQRDFQPIDEFDSRMWVVVEKLKEEILELPFPQFYGLVEWYLRNLRYDGFRRSLHAALTRARAPYRIIDGDTLVPITNEEDLRNLERALVTTQQSGFSGAQAHLKAAASLASQGAWASCVRESIHAVESVAVRLSPGTKEIGPALKKLEETGAIHGGMRAGFSSLYGYASNEEGIRHALLEKGAANVDEADALFMLGACAAFVSYLITKGRSSGLLSD